jgi:hypothetical protein
MRISIPYLFITTHMPFQVIHFSSVDTDHLGDSKLFIDIVLFTINKGHTVSNMNTELIPRGASQKNWDRASDVTKDSHSLSPSNVWADESPDRRPPWEHEPLCTSKPMIYIYIYIYIYHINIYSQHITQALT